MAIYAYRARDASGKLKKGQIQADNEHEAASKLLGKALTPLYIARHDEKQPLDIKAILQADIWPSKVKLSEMNLFCRQMYTLVKAGVPIVQSISQLAISTEHKGFSKALLDIAKALEGGSSLSNAMRQAPFFFSPMFVHVCEAGENSGRLEEAFLQMSDYFTLEEKTKKRIASATRYPIMVFVSLIIALMIINFLVIPAFANMFLQFGKELPLMTRVLLNTSAFLIGYWPFLLIGIVLFSMLSMRYINTKSGRHKFDRFKLKVPIIGSIFQRILIARFARLFTMMIESGVPIIQSINLVANAIGNDYVKRKILVMRRGIERGDTLLNAATDTQLFSPVALQMLSVGESSGKIDDMLNEVADFYEREVDFDLGRLGDLIEPLMLGIMGGMVLILALGVFLPMWDMVKIAM